MKFKNNKSSQKEIGTALVMFSQIGITMVVSIGMCLFIGIWLDEWLHTAPWLMIVFIFLGVLAAFRNVYVMTKRFWKH